MYRKLQDRAKKYIIDSLCKSSGLGVDIDTDDKDKPIIVIQDLYGVVTRAEIEILHDHLPAWNLAHMGNFYGFSVHDALCGVGCEMIKCWVTNIYGIKIIVRDIIKSNYYAIVSRNKHRVIQSYIYYHNLHPRKSVCPFLVGEWKEHGVIEDIVPSFLLLLDPIEYFRRYSVIIEKYPGLKTGMNRGHTLGIYELLLEYFPEMNGELFKKYLLLRCLLEDCCSDLVFVVGSMLVNLYI